MRTALRTFLAMTLGLGLLAPVSAQGFIDQGATTTATGTTVTENNVSINDALGLSGSAAEPVLLSTLTITNTRLNRDADVSENRPGDVLAIELKVTNQGPGTERDYAALVSSEVLFKIAEPIEEDKEKVEVKQNRALVFPAMDLTMGQTETFEVKVKLAENTCQAFTALIQDGALIQFEDKIESMSIDCTSGVTTTVPTPSATTTTTTTTTATTTPTAVTATESALDRAASTFEAQPVLASTDMGRGGSTFEAVLPPKTPETGPELILLAMISSLLAMFFWKQEESVI